MTRMGLKTRCQRRFRVTSQASARRTPVPNLLAQDFSVTRPNQKWLVDITYIATREGWLYLAGVLDIYSRRIAGWSMRERLTEPLVCDALRMALAQRGAPDLHHSDQGSQYTSHTYLALLEKAQVQVSMSAVGRCYDNAMKESFWATLKSECADHIFQTRALARLSIFEYIEIWYNRQRRHSALGYLSPCAFEQLGCPWHFLCPSNRGKSKHGISQATFYNWKSKYGGMEASDVKRLRDLEQENARLKRMYAELSLDHQILKDIIEKKL